MVPKSDGLSTMRASESVGGRVGRVARKRSIGGRPQAAVRGLWGPTHATQAAVGCPLSARFRRVRACRAVARAVCRDRRVVVSEEKRSP